MTFLELFHREMQGSPPRLAFMAALGGISTAAILASVNSGAESAEAGKADLWAAALFVVSLILFIKTQHYIMITTTAEIEAIIHRIRVRILDKVRQAELAGIEEIGRAAIVAAVTEAATTLTQAANVLTFSLQGAVLVVLVALYVAYLSPLAFVLSALIIGVAGAVYRAKNSERSEGMREAAAWGRKLITQMSDLLDGFKEVRLNSARSNDLIESIREVSRRAANIRIFNQSESFKQIIFSQSALYVLLGSIVFIVPTFSTSADSGSITKNTMAVLFVVGTCFGLMQAASMMAAADSAADNIERLESTLQAAIRSPPGETAETAPRLESIEVRNAYFKYPDKPGEPGFQIGPIDFVVRSGETVFISGGNGSGKSTFLKMLAGLYAATSGSIFLNGVEITDDNRENYRSVIAAVFTDSHLFHRLFGIQNLEAGEVDRLLKEVELENKTRLIDDEFSTLDLSGGQRKRLAFVVSLLEKRPLLLLDELTANQDPEFRRRFYAQILPELKESGLTVVLVTHDDRHLEALDLHGRRLRMDEGRFV